MTANQIAWWNIQEQIRSHQQNEQNERNKQSITENLGNEQNRISNQKVKNDFILGQQGNDISQQQANTAARRATQDYDIGLKEVEQKRVSNVNQAQRNTQDYAVGTRANQIKATDVSNNYILGRSGQEIQSIRNAQDYALGLKQQTSNARQADAAMLNSSANFGKLNPAQIVVALAAPTAQKAVDTGVKKVVDLAKKSNANSPSKPNLTVSQVSSTPVHSLNTGQKAVTNHPRFSGKAPTPTSSKTGKKATTKTSSKTSPNKNSASKYRR